MKRLTDLQRLSLSLVALGIEAKRLDAPPELLEALRRAVGWSREEQKKLEAQKDPVKSIA